VGKVARVEEESGLAVTLLIELNGMTESMYAELCDRVELHDDPPEGLIFHGAGPSPDGWRILDVWDTRGHWDAYFAEVVRPALDAMAREAGYDALDSSRAAEWDLTSYRWGPGPLVNIASM
jgi:hypothetical protein